LPYSWTLEEALPHSEIIATLEIGKIEVDNYYSLKTLLIHVRLIYRVVAVSLHPVSSTNLILLDRVHFLYALLQNTPFDFATHAITSIWNVHQGLSGSALLFRGLIMRIAGTVNVDTSVGGDIQTSLGPFTKDFMSKSVGHLTRVAPKLGRSCWKLLLSSHQMDRQRPNNHFQARISLHQWPNGSVEQIN